MSLRLKIKFSMQWNVLFVGNKWCKKWLAINQRVSVNRIQAPKSGKKWQTEINREGRTSKYSWEEKYSQCWAQNLSVKQKFGRDYNGFQNWQKNLLHLHLLLNNRVVAKSNGTWKYLLGISIKLNASVLLCVTDK